MKRRECRVGNGVDDGDKNYNAKKKKKYKKERKRGASGLIRS